MSSFQQRRTGQERELQNNMKRGKLCYTELGLGSLWAFGLESLSLGHCGSASLGCSGYGCSRVDRVNV